MFSGGRQTDLNRALNPRKLIVAQSWQRMLLGRVWDVFSIISKILEQRH